MKLFGFKGDVKEGDSANPVFIKVEGEDHLITDEAKRHKMSLMFFSSLLIAMCFFPDAYVKSILGVITFAEADYKKIDEFLWVAMLVAFYFALLYKHYYGVAIKKQKNKKLTEEGVSGCETFNRTFDEINLNVKECERIYQVLSEQCEHVDSGGELGKMWAVIDDYLKYIEKPADPLRITSKLDGYAHEIEHIGVKRKREHEIANELLDISRELKKYSDLNRFISKFNSEYKDSWSVELKRLYWDKFDVIHRVFSEKYRIERLIANNNRLYEQHRNEMVSWYKDLSINEEHQKFIYCWLPFLYFCCAEIYAFYIIFR
ncbi:hypothetical protein [Shewanella atlantica]|uniref:hypothetical protein n=1 Tax=Shewanella atlantica TaxID=271099 RepID=UPI003735288A